MDLINIFQFRIILFTILAIDNANAEIQHTHTHVTQKPQGRYRSRSEKNVLAQLLYGKGGGGGGLGNLFDRLVFGNKRGVWSNAKSPLPDLKEDRKPQNKSSPKETDLCFKEFWNVEFQKSVTFSSQNFGVEGETYEPNLNCTVLYQGTRKCTPVLSCETLVKLRKRIDGICKEDYLLVSDGLGGAEKFCGNDVIFNIQPSRKGKDLYIQLVTGDTQPELSRTGFKCMVSCKTDFDEVTSLKIGNKKKKVLSSCICGLKSKGELQRIVGGINATEFEYPWLVAIVTKQSRQPICGGAIINDRHVLTAAHCFTLSKLEAKDVEVLIHAHLLDATISGSIANVPLGEEGSIRGIGYNLDQKTDEDENSTRHVIESIVVHPMFNEGYDNDVAIIKLETTIDLTSENGATPICLPKYTPRQKTYKGLKTVTAGWGIGHETAAATNRILQKLEDVPIIDHKLCEKLLVNDTISNKMLCAGFLAGEKDTCTGDSGGPLMFQDISGQFVEVGIVSWGSGCGQPDSPGVYTDVQEMMEWVNFHTSDSNVHWCEETLATHNDD